ncbi:O-antigen ligase family protein [Pelagovum sp. HNIBRBA483]|uniref:O-antigen ligase family protein n=1 Tax=Pelagovum sp. HNIBRBA483 TaxID=3233341 RepID=UPI0034A318DB
MTPSAVAFPDVLHTRTARPLMIAASLIGVAIIALSVANGGNRVYASAPFAMAIAALLAALLIGRPMPRLPRRAFLAGAAFTFPLMIALTQLFFPRIWPTPLPHLAAASVMLLAMLLALYLAVFWVAHAPPARGALMIVLFGGITCHALWAVFSAAPFATGGFYYRNAFASFAGLGTLIGLFLFSVTPIAGARIPVLVATLVCFVAVLASGSRLGTLSCLCGCGLYIAFSRPRLHMLALSMIALICLLPFAAPVITRLPLVSVNAPERLELYAQVWNMITFHPVFGSGAGGFVPAFEAARGATLSAAFSYDHAHNSPLAAFAAFGIVVGTVPFLLLGSVTVALIRSARQSPLARLAASGLAMAALHALGDFTYEIPANAALLTVILALGCTDGATS